MSQQYYLYHEGQIVGPYDPSDVRSWNMLPETQVCLAGSEEWQLLAQVPQLLPPPTTANLHASPLMAEGMAQERHAAGTDTEITKKKKIFIIHGRGNTMNDAFGRLINLVRVKFRYYQSKFYVDSENSNFVRYLLYDTQTNPYSKLFDRIIVGKIALSPYYPPPQDWLPDETWTALSEFKVSDKLRLYGVPMGAVGANRDWVDAFFRQIWNDFGPVLGEVITSQPALAASLINFRMQLRPGDGGLWLEREYKDAIRSILPERGVAPEPFIDFLLEFQRLNDAGGDLDTIASNALYGAWILQAWQAKFGASPRYGRDFEFDFVNYHQSFLHLARHKNCELFLPDFPMEAIPDLEEAAKAIIDAGSFLVRIDDHHPMGQEKFDLLERLKVSGFFGDYVMSGPVKGTEQSAEEKTCGADLVHHQMIAGRGFDSPGLEELRRLAHQQDLHLIENPDDRNHLDYLAIDLSKLIGSKHSRIDMAQQLMFVRSYEDLRQIMATTGWRQKVDSYETELERVLPGLEKCMARIDFVIPAELESARGSLGIISTISKLVKAITFGAVDIETNVLSGRRPELTHRIFVALAPSQSRREPRINVASAIGYLKRFFRFDYFFYAWGASLLTTRRFNDKDQALDLSVLMPIIGGPGDGGHSSAATCKPPSNAAWPKKQFDRLKNANFQEYAKYIAGRVAGGAGVQIVSVKMMTDMDKDY